MIAISDSLFGPYTTIYGINSQDDGSVTLTINPQGDVLSVQPDRSFQSRPKGTAREYEKAYIQGNLIIYHPYLPGTPPVTHTFIIVQDNLVR